jgi:hypothetical protein
MKKFPQFEEAVIEDMKLGKDGLSATISHSGVAQIAAEMAEILEATNCKNYLQFVLYPMLKRGIRPVEVTLRWYWGGKTPAQKATELETELDAAKAFHPRAMKLIGKKKPFLVVAIDEPYFVQVYGMIRAHEIQIGRWTDEDERRLQELVGEVLLHD